LAGLVAIAGSCALVDLWAALLIGVVAAFVNIIGSKMLVRAFITPSI
jgi:ammonia channel protein AmtB